MMAVGLSLLLPVAPHAQPGPYAGGADNMEGQPTVKNVKTNLSWQETPKKGLAPLAAHGGLILANPRNVFSMRLDKTDYRVQNKKGYSI